VIVRTVVRMLMIRLSRLLMSIACAVLVPSLALAAPPSAFEYYHAGYGTP
jgi:hypothetical protein